MTLIEVNESREEITQRQRWSHYFVFIYALYVLFESGKGQLTIAIAVLLLLVVIIVVSNNSNSR